MRWDEKGKKLNIIMGRVKIQWLTDLEKLSGGSLLENNQ